MLPLCFYSFKIRDVFSTGRGFCRHGLYDWKIRTQNFDSASQIDGLCVHDHVSIYFSGIGEHHAVLQTEYLAIFKRDSRRDPDRVRNIFIRNGTSIDHAQIRKMGCSKSVVGLVIPTGYSFNLDGTSIYLSMSVIFWLNCTISI